MIDVLTCEVSGPTLVIIVTELDNDVRKLACHVYACHDNSRVRSIECVNHECTSCCCSLLEFVNSFIIIIS